MAQQLIKVFDRGVAVGDVLYLDGSTNKKMLFARPAEVDFLPSSGTYTQTLKGVSTTYTAPFTSVGVVFHVDGRKVYVINKTSGGALQYKTERTADGEALSYYYKKSGGVTLNRGILNVAKGADYWATNGYTPTEDEPLIVDINNYASLGRTSDDVDKPVTRAAFETNTHCKLLRQTYGNYENYISENCGVKFPQEYGCFSLPSGKVITYQYNNSEHPAFQHCAGVTYYVDGLAAGDWYLPGVYEGTALMRDAVLAKVNASMDKISGAKILNNAHRWFAQRYGAAYAWNFNGTSGTLSNPSCTYTFQVQAIVLLEI